MSKIQALCGHSNFGRPKGSSITDPELAGLTKIADGGDTIEIAIISFVGIKGPPEHMGRSETGSVKGPAVAGESRVRQNGIHHDDAAPYAIVIRNDQLHLAKRRDDPSWWSLRGWSKAAEHGRRVQ